MPDIYAVTEPPSFPACDKGNPYFICEKGKLLKVVITLSESTKFININ